MIDATSTSDVFRYAQLRRARPLEHDTEGGLASRAGAPDDAVPTEPSRGTSATAQRGTNPAAQGGTSAAARRRSDAATRAALRATVEEVLALAATVVPEPVRAAVPAPPPSVALPGAAVTRLSDRAREVLEGLGVDPGTTGLRHLVAHVEAALSGLRRPAPLDDPPPPPEPEERPYLRSVGVADLLVVKQHLVRYDRADIAHVENVLAGETRSRTHRSLERVEETFTTERQTTHERETELETTERFEMHKETSKTIERDRRFGFGLTVSGRYGPSVDFSSNVSVEESNQTQETAESATTYAKDVMSRTLERVVEQVREERVLRILREQEETNLHGFANTGPDHVVGVYQFLEKVYESQVFSYGLRQILDVVLPEPAAHLWWLEATPTQGLNLPTPPPRLAAYVASAEAVAPDNYLGIAALYGVDGLDTPPPAFLTVGAAVSQGASEGDEEGQPRSIVEKELPIPEGYQPWFAQLTPHALTDDQLTLAVSVGGVGHVWRPTAAEQVDVGSDHSLASTVLGLGLSAVDHVPGSTLSLQVVAFETATFAVTVQVTCLRTAEAMTRWRIATYDALAGAYADALKRYELQVAELTAAAENAARQATAFGNAPSQNAMVIRDELKRQCISVITRDRFDEPNGVVDDDPPYVDFPVAEARGSFARFFEQAVEWDQLQYVCYPYYWARKELWDDRLRHTDVDPAFLEFLKAGAARVVLPVRPGFEVALSAYLEREVLWDGTGEPPDVESDTYLPIVTEIKERTGADQGEVPVGEPWETRVPTSLVIVRDGDDLPRWERVSPDGWQWREVDPEEDAGGLGAAPPAAGER